MAERTRVLRQLTAAVWDSLGSDTFRSGPPRIVNQVADASGWSTFTCADTTPASNLGLPAIPLGEDELHFYMENADGRRHEPAGIRGDSPHSDSSGLTDPKVWGVARSNYSDPPWQDDADNPNYYQGHLGRFSCEFGSYPTGFQWQLDVPLNWYAVDPALLLFILARFYSAGGVSSRQYMDRQALLDYSAGVNSYLRRRRTFTWRIAGESLIDHAKRVALDASAMMRYGGFQDGSDTIQQLGLGILDWDTLRNLSSVYNADPLEDAGRDMFLTEPLVVRTAEEYIINSVLTRWGGGWLRTFQYRNELGGVFYETSTDFPFTPVPNLNPPWAPPLEGPPNVYEDRDSASIGVRGERFVERELPSILDPESGDNVGASRWVDPRRLVEFAMGPLHWDYDVGDVIHVRHTGLGLDGTEDLLVLSKTIDWDTLHATVQAIEVAIAPPGMAPTDPALGTSCKVWIRADVGVTVSGGQYASQWLNLADPSNNFTTRAGFPQPFVDSESIQTRDFGVVPVPSFEAGPRGLEIPGTLFDYNNVTEPPRERVSATGLTIIALVKVYGDAPGWILTSDVNDWGVGIHWPDVFGIMGVRYPDGTLSNPSTWVAPIIGQWHLITMVYNNRGDGERVELLRGIEDAGSTDFRSDLWDLTNLALGFRTGAGTEGWPGAIAELQVFATALRPDHIRRLHHDIRERYPLGGF